MLIQTSWGAQRARPAAEEALRVRRVRRVQSALALPLLPAVAPEVHTLGGVESNALVAAVADVPSEELRAPCEPLFTSAAVGWIGRAVFERLEVRLGNGLSLDVRGRECDAGASTNADLKFDGSVDGADLGTRLGCWASLRSRSERCLQWMSTGAEELQLALSEG